MSHSSHSEDAPNGFASHADARDFWLLCLTTFLCFLSLSQTALLSVVLAQHAIPTESIGVVLASYGITVILCALAAGPLGNRIGALHTLRLGLAILLSAHVSYHFSTEWVWAAIGSRLLQGVGFGLFLSSAMAYATSKLSPTRMVYLLGIYASMVQLPNAFGPPLAEIFLDHFGNTYFFLVGALPVFIALPISWKLQRTGSSKTRQHAGNGLADTLRHKGIHLPLIAILVVGALLGLISSYMAPLLIDKHVPIACFFTAYPITAFVSRFFFLGWMERWSRRNILIMGFGCMALSYALLATTSNAWIVTALAIVFGLGSSVSYPTLSAWVSDQFPPHGKTMPLAIFNTAFNLGLVLTPFCAGYLIAHHGYDLPLLLLAAGSVLISSAFALTRTPEQAKNA